MEFRLDGQEAGIDPGTLAVVVGLEKSSFAPIVGTRAVMHCGARSCKASQR